MFFLLIDVSESVAKTRESLQEKVMYKTHQHYIEEQQDRDPIDYSNALDSEGDDDTNGIIQSEDKGDDKV